MCPSFASSTSSAGSKGRGILKRLPGENPDREGVAMPFMISKLRIVINLSVALVLIAMRKSTS